MNFTPLLDANGEEIAELAGIPFIESESRTRGEVIVVRAGAFMDSPSTPAVVIHPIDAAALRIAWLTGRRMNDLDVMTEAVLSVIARRATVQVRRAIRRMDQMVDTGDERTRVQVEMFLHPLEHGMFYDRISRTAECQDCDYTVTDWQASRYGMRVQL